MNKYVLIIIALGVAFLSGASAIATSLARIQPQVAMTMPIANGPGTARTARFALGQAMAEIAENQGENAVALFPNAISEQTLEQAERAFLSEPLSEDAAMILGLAANANGQTERARALLQASQNLSRREGVSSLWLARDAAEQGNTKEALRLFDQILRTSRATRPALLRQFAAATAENEFRAGMTDLLRSNPPWAAEFWRTAPDVEAAAKSVGELRLALANSPIEFAPGPDTRIAYNLVNQGELALAKDIYRRLAPNEDRSAIVTSGEFGEAPVFPPVDWQVYSTGDFGSEIDEDSGLLFLYASGSPGGAVARQWVSLSAGSYRIRATSRSFGMERGDELEVQLTCIAQKRDSRKFSLQDGGNELVFQHSGDCQEHWLDIVASPAERNPGFEAEIDRILIEPIGG